MLLPDSMELRICVPYNSRSTAWASFDGRGRVELKRTWSMTRFEIYSRSRTEGDHIKVTASKYPFPTVCADKQSTDWFHAISRTLKWNERERQKSFVVVEEGPSTNKTKSVNASAASRRKKPAGESVVDDEEDEVSDEEEDTFDIDDSSPENQKDDAEDKLGTLPAKSPLAKRRQKSRSRSRSGRSSHSSGLDSPPRSRGNRRTRHLLDMLNFPFRPLRPPRPRNLARFRILLQLVPGTICVPLVHPAAKTDCQRTRKRNWSLSRHLPLLHRCMAVAEVALDPETQKHEHLLYGVTTTAVIRLLAIANSLKHNLAFLRLSRTCRKVCTRNEVFHILKLACFIL